jgi:hypothetical protein
MASAAQKVYNSSVATQIHMRSRAEILRFCSGDWSASRESPDARPADRLAHAVTQSLGRS